MGWRVSTHLRRCVTAASSGGHTQLLRSAAPGVVSIASHLRCARPGRSGPTRDPRRDQSSARAQALAVFSRNRPDSASSSRAATPIPTATPAAASAHSGTPEDPATTGADAVSGSVAK